eukprot:6704463-Heterocapsa_arctica.AAC.1
MCFATTLKIGMNLNYSGNNALDPKDAVVVGNQAVSYSNDTLCRLGRRHARDSKSKLQRPPGRSDQGASGRPPG